MKKIALLIAGLVFTAGSTFAQTAYNFTHTTGIYTPLTNATSINNGQVWGNQAFQVPIGFNFFFYDQVYTSLYVSGGNLGFEISPKKVFTVLNFSADRGATASQSPISYTLTGNPGSRILKIEWANAGYHGYAQDSVNAQVWLYEETKCLEVRFGPNAVCCADSYDYPFTDATGEFIGVYAEDGNGGTTGYQLEGAPASPVMSTNTITYHGMNGTPADGTIYKFCPVNSTGVDEEAAEDIGVYPNPVTDLLNISTVEKIESISVFDLSGRLVISESSVGSSLDLSKLESGMYLLRIQTADGAVTRKITKQ